MYNEDGTAIKPEKTSEHDLIVDPGSIVTGFCNSTTPISLGVANKAGSGGLSVGDHFPGEQVRYHNHINNRIPNFSKRIEVYLFVIIVK